MKEIRKRFTHSFKKIQEMLTKSAPEWSALKKPVE